MPPAVTGTVPGSGSGRITTFLKLILAGSSTGTAGLLILPQAGDGLSVRISSGRLINWQSCQISCSLSGRCGFRFELMARPSRDVARVQAYLMNRIWIYFNQMESWREFHLAGEYLISGCNKLQLAE